MKDLSFQNKGTTSFIKGANPTWNFKKFNFPKKLVRGLNAVLLAALTSSLLPAPKAFAHHDMEVINIVRVTGWIQASCRAHQLGMMARSDAQIMMDASFQYLEKKHPIHIANNVRKLIVDKNPHCDQLIT